MGLRLFYYIMLNIYRSPFTFTASRYEEYKNGTCIAKGTCDLTIKSIIKENFVLFDLEGSIPVSIKPHFGLPIFGQRNGDILEGRIQYGRLPDNLYWDDPNDPIVCNIFANETQIRFAMLNPLRIVELYGKFEKIEYNPFL